MSTSFDPNIPAAGSSTDPRIEGYFDLIEIAEQPAIGKANLVINGAKSFDIKVNWHFEGNLTPLWLTALSVKTKEWVVSAYANARGPGGGVILGTAKVAVGGPFTDPMSYSAVITVPAHTLPEENPGGTSSGVYQFTVTVFLDSDLGPVGYDMMGVADFPAVKVEDPR